MGGPSTFSESVLRGAPIYAFPSALPLESSDLRLFKSSKYFSLEVVFLPSIMMNLLQDIYINSQFPKRGRNWTKES